MSMYTDEREDNTPERAWVSLGERRTIRLRDSILGEVVSPGSVIEEQQDHPSDNSSHQHGKNRPVQSNRAQHSTYTPQRPEGGYSGSRQAAPSSGFCTLHTAGSTAKDKPRGMYELKQPHSSRHGEGKGPFFGFLAPSEDRPGSSRQQNFEKPEFGFNPQRTYSISSGMGLAATRAGDKLEGSTTETIASTIFNTPESVGGSANPPIVPTLDTIFDGDDEDETTIANPLCLAGQRIGALLSIMRVPNKIKKITKGSAFTMVMEVGDVVKVLGKVPVSDTNGKDYIDYAVENMRTGAKVIVAWSTFLPVGIRELCDCRGQRCRCVYVDYEKTRRFFGIGN